jgi:Right handed beta helix region
MSAKWIAFIMLALATTGVHGAAQRTFVASNGVDSNPCSIAQPCRSFGTAIGKTVAGGEIIVLDSAGYGVVTIAKSVSLIAPSGVYAGVSAGSGQTGVTVNGAGIVVVLRGLNINGIGAGSTGIQFMQGSRLRIESCTIGNLSSAGIVQQASGSEMVVLDTVVRDNGGAGIIVSTDASMLLDGVRVEHNAGDGVFVVPSTSLADATIRNSVMSHNGQAGVAFTMAANPAVTRFAIESSAISRNGADGIFAGGNNTGQIVGVVRRNVIVGNGLSGISAFNLVNGGQSSVQTADNSFSGNGFYAIKVQGYPSQAYSSGNLFAWYENTFWTSGDLGTGAGYQASYGDNTGESKASGPPPAVFSKF